MGAWCNENILPPSLHPASGRSRPIWAFRQRSSSEEATMVRHHHACYPHESPSYACLTICGQNPAFPKSPRLSGILRNILVNMVHTGMYVCTGRFSLHQAPIRGPSCSPHHEGAGPPSTLGGGARGGSCLRPQRDRERPDRAGDGSPIGGQGMGGEVGEMEDGVGG